MKGNNVRFNINNFHKIKFAMIIGFSSAFAVITLLIVGTMLYISNTMLTNKIGTMARNMNEQFREQVNSTIDSMENMALYLYSSPEFYQYDPTDTAIGEYERLVNETNLSTFLYNLGVMGEYADLGVVYRNNKLCGRVSDATRKLFGTDMFAVLEDELTGAKSDEAWVTGYNDSFARIYYLKRLNDNGIFLLSVYTSAMAENLVKKRQDMELTIRVINGDGRVIFGNTLDSTGTAFSVENRHTIPESVIGSFYTSTDLVLIDQCSNGWYVVSTALTKDIFRERDTIISMVIILFFFALGVIVVFCIVFSLKLTIPIELLVKKLNLQSSLDIQTRLFHRDSFAQFVSGQLAAHSDLKGALVLIDIDNFKKANTDYGHQKCDAIIIEVIDSIRECFPQNSAAGRVGGDEFSVYVPVGGIDEKGIHQYLTEVSGRFLDRVHDRVESRLGISSLTCSIGISFFPDQGKEYELLFTLSDKALAAAKENGKNQSHIYDVSKDYNRWTQNQEV